MKTLCYAVAFVCLTIALAAVPSPVFPQTAPNDQLCQNNELCQLAQQFRPYLKFSKVNGKDEQIHPCSWQYFVGDSVLYHNRAVRVTGGPFIEYDYIKKTVLNNPSLNALYQIYLNGGPNMFSELLMQTGSDDLGFWSSDVRAGTLGTTRDPNLWLEPEHPEGESWDSVKTEGHGIYAHVEEINDDLVNIEYIILYPYNNWSASDSCEYAQGAREFLTGAAADHSGDLTSLVLVYSKGCKQIIRAHFSIHGNTMLSYDLSNSVSVETNPSSWIDGNVNARKVTTNHYFIQTEFVPIPFIMRDFYENKGCDNRANNYVYFVQDPDTGRFEHIAAFIEWGSHEMYPASCGDAWCCRNHEGLGTSFLPDKVTYLGKLADLIHDYSNGVWPGYFNYAGDATFLFFNGKWGEDPQPPIMHRSWYYPENRDNNPWTKNPTSNNPFGIPDDRFVDKDPYHVTEKLDLFHVCDADANCYRQYGLTTLADVCKSDLSCYYAVHQSTHPFFDHDDICVHLNPFPWPPENVCASILQPPITAWTLSGPTYSNGGVTYVSGGATVSFAVTLNDVTAAYGAASTYYRVYPVEGARTGFVQDTGGFMLTGLDGAYQIDYYSIDALGNQEAMQSFQLILDTTPPIVTITQPTAGTYAHSATITLNYGVDDGAGSGVAIVTPTLDGNTTIAGHGLASGQMIILLTELALGTHTFTVTGIDQLGNSADSSVAFSVTVTPKSIADDLNQFTTSGQVARNKTTSLLAKLNAAAAARDRGQCSTAANIYQAFINELEAQSGKGVDVTAAAIMIDDARYLIEHCP